MNISEYDLLLGGAALAHAAWSLSDLKENEELIPLAFLENDEKRELVRFERDIELKDPELKNAYSCLEFHKQNWLAWAFAFVPKNTNNLYIRIWSREMGEILDFIFTFSPASSGSFNISEVPRVSMEKGELDKSKSSDLLKVLYQGVLEHPEGKKMWGKWCKSV